MARRTLVALAAQGSCARLHGRRHMGRPPGGVSGRTEAAPLAKPRARRVISAQLRTTTRWPASRGMSGAPPSAGVMPRRCLRLSTAVGRFWRRTTISANGPALKAMPWRSAAAYRETLTRHAVLLKQAEDFRARPDEFASLLSRARRHRRARTSMPFEDLHARARRHRRAATMRHVHRIKREAEQEAQQPKPELRQGELAREGRPCRSAQACRYGDAGHGRDAVFRSRRGRRPSHIDTVPPVEAEDYPWALAAAAQGDVPPPDRDPPKPDWYAPYEALPAGLERTDRERPANRRALILCRRDTRT